MTDSHIDNLKRWEGNQSTDHCLISPWPAHGLGAILDWDAQPNLGDELPSPWHWVYFLATPRQSELGEDGHPGRGDFLPPVELPRRMWASGNIAYYHPLRIGDTARRVTTIRSVEQKAGRSGKLLFVLLEHDFYSGESFAFREQQTIVYRGSVGSGAPQLKTMSPEDPPDFTRTLFADSVLLFRYSALTFNAHRIHYDRSYAVEFEGYDDLVVHGPLIATLLMDFARREIAPGDEISRYDYRAIRPLLANRPFHLEARKRDSEIALCAVDKDGAVTMQATITLRET